jgi:hypothetical protein
MKDGRIRRSGLGAAHGDAVDPQGVGWPTPTGTLWPSLPQVPTPGSSAMSLPIIDTLVIVSGPLPIRVAPFTGAPILPSSIR